MYQIQVKAYFVNKKVSPLNQAKVGTPCIHLVFIFYKFKIILYYFNYLDTLAGMLSNKVVSCNLL
jgi:hypothetical protein